MAETKKCNRKCKQVPLHPRPLLCNIEASTQAMGFSLGEHHSYSVMPNHWLLTCQAGGSGTGYWVLGGVRGGTAGGWR